MLITVRRIRLEPQVSTNDEALKCLSRLLSEAFPAFRSVDTDQSHSLKPPVDRCVEGVAVDDLNNLDSA
ncbi:MAG: hypothetical protein R2733_12430 [Acidimicrobiales bacterium]